MKIPYKLIVGIIAAAMLLGCGSEESSEKPLSGTPEIKDAPPGSVAPGDSRPNPAASDESRG